MNTRKVNGLTKLVSFILIAILLLCAVGFISSGWQSTDNTADNEKDDEEVGAEIPENNKPVEIPKEPVYYNAFTGLAVDKTVSTSIPYGFVLDPASPLYGVSGSDMILEFPTEYGGTRMLAYTSDRSMLWKIGALTPTRDFISEFSDFFGGLIVSLGCDDKVNYSLFDDKTGILDLSAYDGHYYTESARFNYTGKEKIESALALSDIKDPSPYKTPPFSFVEDGKSFVGNSKATAIKIPYGNTTELVYSDAQGEYYLLKSGKMKTDMLNGEAITAKNVFVLFASMVTYDRSDGVELVVDNSSGGVGYYISEGALTEIRWSIGADGMLRFTDHSGKQLSVNRGRSYIAYYKASSISDVKYE